MKRKASSRRKTRGRPRGPAIVEAARKSRHIKRAVRGRHVRHVQIHHGSRLLAAQEPRTPVPRVRL